MSLSARGGVQGLPPGVRIRPLSAGDVPGAIAVKNRGWHDAYSAWLSAEALAAKDAAFDSDVAGWRAALEKGTLFPSWVAVGPDDAVIGLGSGGPVELNGRARGGRVGPGDASEAAQLGVTHELCVLYVDTQWRGAGVADALLAQAIGEHPALLWVLEDNPRAHGFYRKHGFEPDGAAEDMPPEWGGAREVRMVRVVRASSGTEGG